MINPASAWSFVRVMPQIGHGERHERTERAGVKGGEEKREGGRTLAIAPVVPVEHGLPEQNGRSEEAKML